MNEAQTQKALADLLARLQPDIAKAFSDVIKAMGTSASIKDLVSALDAGDIDKVVRILKHSESVYFPFEEALRLAFMQGGAFAISQLPPMKNPFTGDKLVISFNGRHNLAVDTLRAYTEDTISGLSAQQQAAVRTIIADGLHDNRATDAIARDLVGRIDQSGRRVGGILGLNKGQADLASKMRRALESGDPKQLKWFLGLEGRDKTFDSVVKRAIKEGTAVSFEDINYILARSTDKMAFERGKIVARTEAHNAIAMGQDQGWGQAINSGALRAQDVTKRWQHNMNVPYRPDHLDMSGKTIAFNETFQMRKGGPMKYAHDPAGGPENNIHCHCTTFYRLRKGRPV